jgi:hypothetical protein
MQLVVILRLENIGLLALRHKSKLLLETSGFKINQSRIAFVLGGGLTALSHLNCPPPELTQTKLR